MNTSAGTLAWAAGLVGAAVGIAALALGAMVLRGMFLPTRGPRIRRSSHPRKAVLVLDLQEGYSGAGARPVTHVPEAGLFGAVNRLVGWAAASGVEVGYVTQVFGADWIVRLHGGRRAGRVVVDRRVRLVSSNLFEKRRTDAFSSRSLEAWLDERDVDELYLAGVDAAYCVTMTARGALNRGYRVNVVADAVRSRHPLPAVLERLRGRGVRIVTTAEVAGGSAAAGA